MATYPNTNVAPTTTTLSGGLVENFDKYGINGNIQNFGTPEDPKTFGNANLLGFYPDIYRKMFRKEFFTTSVLASICNPNIESEFRAFGEKIIELREPYADVKDFDPNGELEESTIQNPEPTIYYVDKGKYFVIPDDDLTKLRTNQKDYMSAVMRRIKQSMQDKIEPEVITAMIGELTASAQKDNNMGATAGCVSHSYNLGSLSAPITIGTGLENLDAANLMADLRAVLAEQSLFEASSKDTGEKPFVLAPWKFANTIAKSELQNGSLTNDSTSLVRLGVPSIGTIQNCDLICSNYLTAAKNEDGQFVIVNGKPVYPILAGTRDAISFYTQLDKLETIRDQHKFRDLIRGLNIYGYKLGIPECLAVAYVQF